MTIRLLLASNLRAALALCAALAASAALCAAVAAPAKAGDFVVATRSAVLPAQRDAFFTPFAEATAITLHEDAADGAAALLHGHMPWDVALVDGATLQAGCADGVFAKLDWPAIGGRDHYQPQAVSECGVGAFVRTVVLAWDREKFPGTPAWTDFWDVAKFPGKRGLQRGARGNLEIALMADGVALGDIYRTLRTDDGVDRAFRKLEQIKPYLVWWRSPAEAPALIGSGGVLLSTAPGERVAANRQFGSRGAGGLYEVESWVLAKASASGADALKLLASMGDPARQSHFAAVTGLGVLARGVTDGLPADQLAASPSNPALLSAALQIDDGFWHDNADKLDERFDAWLAH